MTEEEWLSSTFTPAMLAHLAQPSERKLRLFAVACCLRISPLLKHPDTIRAVETADRYADGRATSEELKRACSAADNHFGSTCVYGTSTGDQPARTAVAASAPDGDAMIHLHHLSFRLFDPDDHAANADLLREVFGNPFRPITIHPSWLTSTVTSLAQGMYESRDFSAMPILADALQDQGCEDEAILAHCRGAGPHVRGCHVIDALTERS